MTRTAKPGPNATLHEALIYVARNPRLYPAVARALVRHVALKVRFYWLCWSSGYRVRTVRRLGRLYRLTGELPDEATPT